MYPILFRFPEWVPVLGGEPVTSFGVMLFLAFLAAGYLLRARMSETGIHPDRAWDLVFAAVIGGIIGAKLYYVFLNFPRLIENPRFLFARGGLVWYGGFLGGTAAVLYQMKRLGLPVRQTLDLTAPSMAMAYAVGRLGCFLVGDDYGRPTASWVGIRFPQGSPPSSVDNLARFGIEVDPALVEAYGQIVPVHPTQLYEIAMALAIFAIVWRLRHGAHPPGWVFALWLALASAARFLVEFVRAKDDRFLGSLTIAQVISLLLIAAAAAAMVRLASRYGGSRPKKARAP